ncbi:MAG TPA: hypothetical protein PKW33_17680 [Anaerolineaceae bacterium]|nr:hypothetical protein [Anaerolineaceae bacterium]HPN53430.1 hypothetical protein [Anaerolineaceae bacterium]
MKNKSFNLLPFSRWLLVLELALIIVTASITYLPNLSQATIYRDDWYYTLDRSIGGPGTFEAMFSIDRPARGPFFEAYYQLFGTEPRPYHLTSFAWRLLAGFAALWLFRQLWPRQRAATFLMTVLFTLYPGYFKWMEGFENQPQIASLCLQVLSTALTVKAVKTASLWQKALWWAGAVISGWAYLALVDFAIGMEAFRLLCVGLAVWQPGTEKKWIGQAGRVLRAWAPALLIAGGYLFWRQVLFTNTRADTDVALQVGLLAQAPLSRGFAWISAFLLSVFNAAVEVWGGPYFREFFGLPPRQLAAALVGVGAAAALVAAGLWIFERRKESGPQPESAGADWQGWAVLAGGLGVTAGVIPVVMANRKVAFEAFSHYALPSSLAAVVFITALIFSLKGKWLRIGVSALLVFLAGITQAGYSSQVIHEEKTIAAFWQQMAWRAPDIQPETTLLVSYPEINYGEDGDAVAGPANFIYFPETTLEIPVRHPLFSLVQMPWTGNDVLLGGREERGYRTHNGIVDYSQMLVISQRGENSCVHVLDSRWPWTAYGERDAIILSGVYSHPERIRADAPSHPVPAVLGPEPEHGWCYYFEKAELAVQTGDWLTAMQLEQEVEQLELRPVDEVEWMPFLQAAASAGEVDRFQQIATRLASSQHNRSQGCRVMRAMQEEGQAFSAEIAGKLDEILCTGLNR